jgi:hypothetical protein
MTKYLMYQGIPFDGDTPQPMFWDVTPIKVVAQADYDAVVAELRAQLAESRRMHDETSVKWQTRVDRCDALEAIIRRFKALPVDCDDSVHDKLWEDANALVAFKESTPRVAHSKSEYKRRTAMGVECAPPETPNYNIPPWHLSKRVPGCRCDGCLTLEKKDE